MSVRGQRRWGRGSWAVVGGGVVSLAAALLFFFRFSLDDRLMRDQAVYVYAGQQLAHGVPPYVSIFDPKGPGATAIAGLAVLVARATGSGQLALVRLAFLTCAVVAVLLMFVLGWRVWRSVLAGVVAAVVLAGSYGFARDALAGPDAKTPGVTFLVAALLLLASRRWFWAGVCASAATLVFQPFVFVGLAVILAAATGSAPGQRLRSAGQAAAGALLPGLTTVAAMAAAGALPAMYQATFAYGVARTGNRPPLSERLDLIGEVVNTSYGLPGDLLIWSGLVLLPATIWASLRQRGVRGRDLLAHPMVSGVLVSLVTQLAFVAIDFQGYPDVYPLLPFAALGVAGAVAWCGQAIGAGARGWWTGAVAAGLAALTVVSWASLGGLAARDRGVAVQRTMACAVNLIAGRAPFYSLGNPVPFVLTHRRSPDRFIYLGSAVDAWKVAHTRGGLSGWLGEIRARDPRVIVVDGWPPTATRAELVGGLLHTGYESRFLSNTEVLVTRDGRQRARRHGVALTPHPTRQVRSATGSTAWTCPAPEVTSR